MNTLHPSTASRPRFSPWLKYVLAGAVQATALAALNVPSDGSDGSLIINQDTEIDLGLAATGAWSANNSAHAGKGIYDPAKWAVVFKYSSLTVSQGANVTFKNHPSRAPVVWLVQGDASINGTVELNGQDGQLAPSLAEPGPGGWRGGMVFFTSDLTGSAGLGPGGGSNRGRAGGASHGTVGVEPLDQFGGTTPAPTYGNPSGLPLLGGSGGGGYGANYGPQNVGGGGGGGAILIACGGSMTVDGTIRANGGWSYGRDSAGGSGGTIRLVANTLRGSGAIVALGGDSPEFRRFGGSGRIRIERVDYSGSLEIQPDPSVVTLNSGGSPLIWLPEDGPSARIISIGGRALPADPRAGFGAEGPDVTLAQVSETEVVIETRNVEQISTVSVRVVSRAKGEDIRRFAALSQVASSDPLVLRWIAQVPVTPGYSAIQVHVVRP